MLLIISGKCFNLTSSDDLRDQIQAHLAQFHASISNFSFTCDGHLLNNFRDLPETAIIRATVPLVGGKGGYGAKLKTQGGKKVRPNDNMFSRDMHGRRIVYTAIEKEFTEYCIKKKAEDQKVAQERQKFKAMESTLKEGQSFMKLDRTYNQQMQQTEKNLYQSIRIGRMRLLQEAKNKKQEKNPQQKVQSLEKEQENGQQNYSYKEYCQRKQNNHKMEQKIQDSQEKQDACGKKRLHPTQRDDEEGCPTKRIKQEQKISQTQECKGEIVKEDKPDEVKKVPVPVMQAPVMPMNSFASARDKLKSLFKK